MSNSHEFETNFAYESAKDHLADMRAHFVRMATEIARYEDQVAMAVASDDPKGAAKIISFVVHNVSTNNGPRLDLLADDMTRLSVLAATK